MGGAHRCPPGLVAGDPASPVHRLDPRAKIAGLLAVTVVAVSAPPRAWPAWVACALVLATVAGLARVPAGAIWRRSRVVLPVVVLAAAFVPFARAGEQAFAIGPLSASREGLVILAGAVAKAAIGTVSAVLLAATTPVPRMVAGLDAMRVPRLLTLTATLMHRYLVVVADELGRMRAALAARGYRPRHALASGALGRMAGALFLRAHARGERVHLAMAARGYAGAMPLLDPLRPSRADAVFVAAIALVIVPARVLA